MKVEGSSKEDAMDCKDDVASLLDDLLRDDVSKCCYFFHFWLLPQMLWN